MKCQLLLLNKHTGSSDCMAGSVLVSQYEKKVVTQSSSGRTPVQGGRQVCCILHLEMETVT